MVGVANPDGIDQRTGEQQPGADQHREVVRIRRGVARHPVESVPGSTGEGGTRPRSVERVDLGAQLP